MDLDALGAFEAARSVLAGYRAAGGDPGDDDLVAFFAAFRALVRAKVALIHAAQSEDPSRLVAGARSLLALAERLAWRARRPGLVVVAGLSASGKTQLASLLSSRSGMRHLNSDGVRKRLLGVAPGARAGAAAYGESFNRRTYAELGRLARRELRCAVGVLVDATFRQRGRPVGVPGGSRRPAGRLRGRVPRSPLGPAGARSSPRRRRGRRLGR